MRIIGGTLKGRSIKFLRNSNTRPLKDNVKENIFNILNHSIFIKTKIANSKILDLYSGIGSFGIECLSRGAEKVYFIEKDIVAMSVLEENLINGCQSRVWLHAEYNNNTVSYYADSDAIITKGIIALLIRVLNNQNPQNILDAELAFIEKIGLTNHLSPTRANGLLEMVKQMKAYAYALQIKYFNA